MEGVGSVMGYVAHQVCLRESMDWIYFSGLYLTYTIEVTPVFIAS